MSADQTLWFGLACAAAIVFTGMSRRVSPHAFRCAIILAAICAATNILNRALYYPEALAPYPVIDAAACAFVAFSFWRRPRIWNTLLSASFLVMLALHVQFWIGQSQGDGYDQVRPYVDTLSDIAKMQLAIVCIPGGVNVWRKLHALRSADLMPVLRGGHRRGSAGDRSEKA